MNCHHRFSHAVRTLVDIKERCIPRSGMHEATASTALLLADSETVQSDGFWLDSLDGPPADQHVIAIALTDTVDTWLQRWRTHEIRLPASLKLVTTGHMRTAATADGGGGAQVTPNDSVHTVPNSGDLTGLAIAIDTQLSAYEEDAEQPVVLFDSLTVLLQYADLRRVFRFLHAMTDRIRAVGSDARFLLDPAAHEAQTVATLRALFDSVMTPDGQPAESLPAVEAVSPIS